MEGAIFCYYLLSFLTYFSSFCTHMPSGSGPWFSVAAPEFLRSNYKGFWRKSSPPQKSSNLFKSIFSYIFLLNEAFTTSCLGQIFFRRERQFYWSGHRLYSYLLHGLRRRSSSLVERQVWNFWHLIQILGPNRNGHLWLWYFWLQIQQRGGLRVWNRLVLQKHFFFLLQRHNHFVNVGQLRLVDLLCLLRRLEIIIFLSRLQIFLIVFWIWGRRPISYDRW